MLEISEKSHTSVLISSLSKIYNKVKTGKPLKSDKLYLLNIVYKLLDGCCIELSNSQRKILLNIYRNLYFEYPEQICPGPLIKKYQMVTKPKFIQADSTDCNTYTKYNKIFYWQESNYLTTKEILEPLIDDSGYFNDKLFDTFANFELGKNIEYNNIGRICFAIMESNITSEYKIYDSLNNDVTHTFDTIFIDQVNTILIVSQNIYSHGNMTFKIKKIV